MPSKKSLHVLQEEGFLPTLFLNLLIILLLAASCFAIPPLRERALDLYDDLTDWMLSVAHRHAWWSLLGLLSSSCCALQLLLNAMSLGCAGFNTVLGPIRPTLLAITLLSQLGSWYVALYYARQPQWKATILSSVVALGFSFLPEMLTMCSFNKRGNHDDDNNNDIITTRHAAGTAATVDGESFKTVCLDMGNSVGCAACVATISNLLDTIDGVVNYQASLEERKLTVTCTKSTNPNILLDRLSAVGFPMLKLSS